MNHLTKRMTEGAPALALAALQRFAASPLRFTARLDVSRYQAPLQGLVEALALAVEGGFVGGHPASREVEHVAAFLGATFAADGATAYDVGALFQALTDAVVQHVGSEVGVEPVAALRAMGTWLTLVAADALAQARVRSLTEQHEDDLETGIPVRQISADVVWICWLGAPSAVIVERVVERAMMLLIATGAHRLVFDMQGLAARGWPSMAISVEVVRRTNLARLSVRLVGTSRPCHEFAHMWQQANMSVDVNTDLRDAIAP